MKKLLLLLPLLLVACNQPKDEKGSGEHFYLESRGGVGGWIVHSNMHCSHIVNGTSEEWCETTPRETLFYCPVCMDEGLIAKYGKKYKD